MENPSKRPRSSADTLLKVPLISSANGDRDW